MTSRPPAFTDQPHLLLDDNMTVWLDAETDRVVLYDFEDDAGISFSRDEWQRVLDWGRALP